MRLSTVAAGLVLLLSPALMAADRSADRNAVEPELALQYDFFDVDGNLVQDGSGHGHVGTIVAGTIVPGRRKPAIELAGTGAVTADRLGPDIEISGRGLTVGAMCKPTAPDGVLVSMGDSTEGFSLYLRDAVPHFAVRTNGVLHEVADTDALNLGQWAHVAGVIDSAGRLSLLVNAWTVAQTAEPASAVPQLSGVSFTIGADARGPVGSYAAPLRWQGLVEDVRLYRGVVSRDAHREMLGDWANRPGCGCRK